jgi:hypothetical protein
MIFRDTSNHLATMYYLELKTYAGFMPTLANITSHSRNIDQIQHLRTHSTTTVHNRAERAHYLSTP